MRYPMKKLTNNTSTSNASLITRPVVVCLLAGICCLLWGSAFPCVKIGYRMFHVETQQTASQILFAGCRFFLAGLLVLLFALIQRKDRQRTPLLPRSATTWKRILILSFFQTVTQYFFFYIGLAHTNGAKASIIEGMNVFICILIASLLFHQERITLRKGIGCLIGFAGVVLINMQGSCISSGMTLTGEGFILISTVCYAFSSAVMKQYTREEDPILLSGWQFLAGGIILMLLGILSGGTIRFDGHLSALAMLLYLAFISAGAYSLWSILLKYNPVSRVSVYGFMNPVFGFILSCLLLTDSSQTIGWISLASLLLVCIGIYIVNRVPVSRNQTSGQELS